MSYTIIKGWDPTNGGGFIDYTLTETTPGTCAGGTIVMQETTGKVGLATYPDSEANNTKTPYFVIDDCPMNAGMVVGLKSPFIVEVDANHYVAGTYSVNDKVSAYAGKFNLYSGNDDSTSGAGVGSGALEVGVVIGVSGATLTILWTATT